MAIATGLLLTGGFAAVLGAVACWAIVDAVGMVRDVEAAARIREHRSSFEAYLILIIVMPLAFALYMGLLFVSLLLEATSGERGATSGRLVVGLGAGLSMVLIGIGVWLRGRRW